MFTIRIYDGACTRDCTTVGEPKAVGASETVDDNIFTVQWDKPVLASEIIKRFGVDCAFPCGGKGSCGKCKVKVFGKADAASAGERRFLTEDERAEGVRLACFCTISGDAEIHVCPPSSQVILGGSRRLTVSGGEKGEYASDGSDNVETGCVRAGIACDIGTTTVVMCLYDLSSGRVLAQESESNCQRAFGADVISRITACDEQGVDHLSRLIRGQMKRMAESCLLKASLMSISKAVVTGNTVMLHIYEGLSPHSLALSPFTVQSFFGRVSTEKLLDAPVFIPGCIGAYAGADVLCAVLSSSMTHRSGYSMIADIGTNGEMAVTLPDGTLLCCSAPAGPAFEGAGISMGMNASEGAVSAVRLNADGFVEHEVIGRGFPEGNRVEGLEVSVEASVEEGMEGSVEASVAKSQVEGGSVLNAVGICGSGLIDCVAVMKKLNAIDDTGYLPEDFTIPSTRVKITQMDIRQVQLAKAAICGGIRTLLHKADISAEQIDKLYIAGGFGNYLNLESAAYIGLMPPELSAVSEFIGNAALDGAAMILLSEDAKAEAEDISRRASELHLSTDPGFTERYIDAMSF